MAATKHEWDRTVRNYLLEFANAGEMVSFEDRYITDPEFLKLVEIEEQRLIEDYLLGHLEPAFRKRFDVVYRQNSHWAPKMNLVRQRLRGTEIAAHGRNRSWTLAITTSALAACLALAVFFMTQKSAPKQTVAKLEVPIAESFIDIRLSPGLNKGMSQASATASVPAGKKRLRFTFDMPGIRGPVSCRAKLLLIEADGTQREIAVSPLSLSRLGPSSEATFVFDNQVLPGGDYLAELMDANGTILGRYVFQARLLP